MSLTTGQKALVARVATMTTTANIMQPNGAGVDLPRYVIQAAGGGQRTATVDGTTQAQPEIVVRVETEAGEYTDENDAMVEALVARFPVGGPRFGGVAIIDAPSPRPPLPIADGVYAVPVVIRGFTSF